MKTKLVRYYGGEDKTYVPISDAILTELGLKIGDVIDIDVDTIHQTIVISKHKE